MKFNIFFLLIIVLFLGACTYDTTKDEVNERVVELKNNTEYKTATFAGGCFWCSESDFEKVDGVIEVISGYTGGNVVDPTYREVTTGKTGHREAIQVTYDPNKVDYNKLLDVFWRHINPTDDGGQFADRGFQYTSAIYYHDDNQKKLAEISLKELNESKRFEDPIVTPIIKATTFYPAEDYHQDYHKKNPIRYNYYREGSGRNDFIEENWKETETEEEEESDEEHMEGDDMPDEHVEKHNSSSEKPTNQSQYIRFQNYVKPSQEELKNTLTELQFYVSQQNGTERSWDNEYNDNKEEGIYVDIVSGEPLFSSTHKYESGTGWPSFTEPIDEHFIVMKKDFKLIIPRTEIRSKYSDSHIGHVFKDGPRDKGGLRYCMNSAAMRFVPKDKMKKEGYGEYLYLFE